MSGDDSAKRSTDDSLVQALASSLVADAGIAPGTALAKGRFVIQRQLGSGGMGTVFEAEDTRDGGRVALKVLQSVSAEATHRLKREFRALSDVIHPNLVVLHELFADPRAWFFTMELVEGVSFLEYVRGPGDLAYEATVASDPSDSSERVGEEVVEAPLDEAKLRAVLPQLSAGVQAIHAAGKLHRDLKPSNVLVTSSGQVKILDFGLAGEESKPGATQTADKHSAGTPAYMAPEQFLGGNTTPASDWYAVGVMLFEALTGRLPFTGTVHDIMLHKRESEAPKVRDIDARAPADLATLADQLLERHAPQRPGWRAIAECVGAPDRADGAGDGSVGGSLSAADSAELVGRAEELERLQRAFDRARGGNPTVCTVSGISGIGKSSLLDAFLRGFESDSQVVVLRGRCFERETVPFNAFDGLVDGLCEHLKTLSMLELGQALPRDLSCLTRVFPGLRRVKGIASARVGRVAAHEPSELQARAFDAFFELLTNLAAWQPIVLAIDDLQWGDRDSAHLLAHLLTRISAAPMLVLLSYRSDELDSSECLQVLLSHRARWRFRPSEIAVAPLRDDDAQQLVQQRGGNQVSPAILRQASGSPFLLLQLVTRLRTSCHNIGSLI